ncbi:hypothetical protein GCM10007063_25110 [Lentibacillus kapialis]|uniref:DUF488 domain-containing protein n=1 Tax=Lentibacillus kapialis TaxID=340214 RepID=A0A917PYT2_9BACI|nr:hypothetical protein GCM10007063_25110 [Lentibacillus kapialis]
MTIYTIGHSTHSKERFTEMLHVVGIDMLADVLGALDRIKIYNTKDERYSVLAEEIYVDSCGRKGIGETP